MAAGAEHHQGASAHADGASQSQAARHQQQSGTVQASGSAQGQNVARTGETRWNDLREKTVSAGELLGADVTSVTNPVGNVRDLVLSEDGSSVQYILYEVPYPYGVMGEARNGFVAFSNVDLEPEFTDTTIRFADEASAQAPEQLTLKRREADHRLVSNLLNDTVNFSGAESRPVEDILIDRNTGKITGYVVNANPDAWFNDEPRVIPADQVQIGAKGDVTTQAEFAALESIE